MEVLYTRAWVLDRVPVGEADELVTLFTEAYGTVRARARSIRKITSKVSSQLQPLALSKVRLIKRNGPKDGFSVLDALTETRPKNARRLIPVARLILDMTHEWEKDQNLWEYLEKACQKEIALREMHKQILSILGFDSAHASCMVCKKTPVQGFVLHKHDFVCASCAMPTGPQASKISESEIVWI